MAYSFRHTNPKLAGVIIREKVRCNRPNCRCMRQNKLHRWYYYLYFRDYQNNGKLKKQYIPRVEVKKLRRKIKSKKAKDTEEKKNYQFHLKLFNQLFL